jgi:single-strand DNA-binding protein
MANVNRVTLIGNITRDIELRRTAGGTAVTDITLAMNHHWKDGAGEKREETVFVDVVVWGRTAEIVDEYCSKGSPLFVEGRLTPDEWTDKDSGEIRRKLKVTSENVQLLGSRQA